VFQTCCSCYSSKQSFLGKTRRVPQCFRARPRTFYRDLLQVIVEEQKNHADGGSDYGAVSSRKPHRSVRVSDLTVVLLLEAIDHRPFSSSKHPCFGQALVLLLEATGKRPFSSSKHPCFGQALVLLLEATDKRPFSSSKRPYFGQALVLLPEATDKRPFSSSKRP